MSSEYKLSMEIDSDLTQTAVVAMAMRGACALMSVDASEINRIELCLVEIVNNAIEHAYGNEKGHPVRVNLLLTDSKLTLEIQDQGKTFTNAEEKLNAPPPEPDPNDPSTWLSSGQGVSIVSRMMDDVSYDSGEGWNVMTMSRNFKKSEPDN
ncbi:ATP-binding protein [Endozoicomonadaceae bacterium StTr2]